MCPRARPSPWRTRMASFPDRSSMSNRAMYVVVAKLWFTLNVFRVLNATISDRLQDLVVRASSPNLRAVKLSGPSSKETDLPIRNAPTIAAVSPGKETRAKIQGGTPPALKLMVPQAISPIQAAPPVRNEIPPQGMESRMMPGDSSRITLVP